MITCQLDSKALVLRCKLRPSVPSTYWGTFCHITSEPKQLVLWWWKQIRKVNLHFRYWNIIYSWAIGESAEAWLSQLFLALWFALEFSQAVTGITIKDKQHASIKPYLLYKKENHKTWRAFSFNRGSVTRMRALYISHYGKNRFTYSFWSHLNK